MLENFIRVFEQVLILFLLMGFGFLFNKTKKLSKQTCKYISDIVVMFVAPCVIVKSFIRKFDQNMLKILVVSLFLSFILHIGMIIISKLVLHSFDEKKRRVMTFGAVFSNAGFVALPLCEAILGGDGVFYCAAYLVVFNIMMWSFGVVEMSGDRAMISPAKLLFSPGIIGIVIGIILFLFSIRPPMVIRTVIDYMSALNVPLPMFIVGYYLAEVDVLNALKDIKIYLCMGLRLVAFPLITILLLNLLNTDSTLGITLAIAVSAPVGATTSMFSEKFDADTALSVKLVAVSTILSILTMPVIIAFAQLIYN